MVTGPLGQCPGRHAGGDAEVQRLERMNLGPLPAGGAAPLAFVLPEAVKPAAVKFAVRSAEPGKERSGKRLARRLGRVPDYKDPQGDHS